MKNKKICKFWGKAFMTMRQKDEKRVSKLSFFAWYHF